MEVEIGPFSVDGDELFGAFGGGEDLVFGGDGGAEGGNGTAPTTAVILFGGDSDVENVADLTDTRTEEGVTFVGGDDFDAPDATGRSWGRGDVAYHDAWK